MKMIFNHLIIYAFVYIVSSASMDLFAQNKLQNGGFEEGKSGWRVWGGEISELNHSGKKSMEVVVLDSPRWSGADQVIVLHDSVKTVDVSGWMKTEKVVKGQNSWEMARIAVEFLDAMDAQVGGYPPVTGQTEGTTEWTFYQQSYTVPDGAKRIKIQTVLGNCTGKAYFDDVEVLLKGEEVSIASSMNAGQNQLKNPGFENGKSGWSFWGGEISAVNHSGKNSMQVKLEKPSWSGGDQIILLGDNVRTVEVSGWMKTDKVVKGENAWEMARIAVEFLDASGNQTGGYPPVTGQAEGTTEWTFYSSVYLVPDGAKRIKIQSVLGNCTGTAYFDDLEVLLKGKGGANVQKQEMTGPMNEGQWYEIKVDKNKSGSHYVDWSSLLDAPAGKHGYLKTSNGHLLFEDGTAVKFWGTNLVANYCFPSMAEADSVALRLSRMGCNLVRLHHMDASWSQPNIFGNKDNTRSLSEESMNKLDYLVSALKKRGIYIFMDLLVNRDFKGEDGIENKPPDLGGKQVAFFDPKIIELQKEFIRQLLTHKNKYTGLTYLEEPAIVGSEFINESSVLLSFAGDILTTPYRKELEAQFKAAGFEGKKLCVFDLDYGKGGSPVLKEKTNTSGDVAASLKFLSQVERNYYKEMYGMMRSLGVKYPLAGSNFPMPLLTYQRDNLDNDLIITNDYWDHPQLWKINNDWSRARYAPINNMSMLKNPGTSTINNICKYKWENKPFMVTEYNDCYPNEYILEGVPFVAAYSSLQGVDGMIQFDFDLPALGAATMDAFSVNAMPDHLAQWVVAAPMFLRGYISPAPGLVLDPITNAQLSSLPNYSDFLDKNNHLCFITKVAKTLETKEVKKVSDYEKFYNRSEGIIKSETGELSLNSRKGILEINTPNVQGVIGELKNTAFDFPMLKVAVKNSWASVLLVSKDNKPLKESGVFYLVVTAPVKMTNQKYNDNRTGLVNPGELPFMAQTVEGELLFKTEKQVIVTPLSPNGERGTKMSLIKKGNNMVFDLSQGKTFVYEVEIK